LYVCMEISQWNPFIQLVTKYKYINKILSDRKERGKKIRVSHSNHFCCDWSQLHQPNNYRLTQHRTIPESQILALEWEKKNQVAQNSSLDNKSFLRKASILISKTEYHCMAIEKRKMSVNLLLLQGISS
jgi:hypothetical protein